MAFNLRNFGTALGGLTGGWNQAQDAYLRQAISRQAMQQQQRQQQAETLAALALMGGNIPGLGGFGGAGAGGGMQNLPTPPMPGAASTPAPTPTNGNNYPTPAPQPDTSWQWQSAGQQPDVEQGIIAQQLPATSTGEAVPPPQPQGGGTPLARGVTAYPGRPIYPSDTGPPSGAPLPAPAPGDTDIDNTKNLRMPGGVPDYASDETTAPGVPPPGGYGAGESVSAPGKPGEPSAISDQARQGYTSDEGRAQFGRRDAAAAPAEQHVIARTPSGQMLSIGNLFQAVNPQTIAQRVAQSAPPGTDPAAIFEATQKLVQMANGNKQEQIMAAQLGKLLGLEYSWAQRKDIEQSKEQTSRDIAAGRSETQLDIAGMRERTAAANREAIDKRMRDKDNKIDARLAQREAFQAEQNAIKRGDAASARQIQAIRASIAAINAQIPRGDRPNDAQQKQLDALGEQLTVILVRQEAVRAGGAGTQLPVEVQNPQQ